MGLGFAGLVQAQADPCATWEKLPPKQKDEAITNHTLYRDLVKAQNFEEAFPMWQKVYNVAPAADGNRSTHYADGRAIYLARFNASTDTTEQKMYSDKVMELFAQQVQCYPKEAAAVYPNQIYYMFYVLKRPYEELYTVLNKTMEVSGDKTDFRVLAPLGYVTTYQYSAKNIDQAEARQTIERARKIAAANASGPSAADYAEAIEIHDDVVASIEPYVFDCAYFKPRFEAEYRANPDDYDNYESVLRQLLRAGCDRSDALVQELDQKVQDARRAEYEANNPMSVAAALYDSGDVDGALAKYEEVASTADAKLKGSIYLQMAGIYRIDKNSASQARNYARKAAAARPGWGKPYLLIGDLYAGSSRSCSTDPFQQRVVILAAMDEYARAKSDPETAGTAQGRINKYAGSTPSAEMLFQRGIKPGSTASTGCWIGETVTLR